MSEVKITCKSSGEEFVVSELEQGLRAKMKLPSPSIAPLERIRAQLASRVLHGLWRNVCQRTEESLIAMYSPAVDFPIIRLDLYHNQRFDARDYGRPIDWQRPLLEQWRELYTTVPRPHRAEVDSRNCDFSNNIGRCRNCYYTFMAADSQNCHYCDQCFGSQQCLDCYLIVGSKDCYQCINCRGCQQGSYCLNCEQCQQCLGCLDCRDCQDCLLCSGLTGQQYYYKNRSLSKEEYDRVLAEYRVDRSAWYRLMTEYYQLGASSVVGDSGGFYLQDTTGCASCYSCREVTSLANCLFLSKAQECLDCSFSGQGARRCVACTGISDTEGLIGCNYCTGCERLIYCEHCYPGVRDCLLSISLNNEQSYCILNQQYSEAEYQELKPRLIAKMTEEGWYGQPLPIDWAIHPYNYTTAYDFLPLDIDQIKARGLRYEPPEDMVAVSNVLTPGDSPVEADEVKRLADQIIKCERTGRPFKLTAAELEVYARHQLPLPTVHPDERYRHRVSMMVPLASLWAE